MEYIENVFPLAIGKTMLEAAMFEFALGIILCLLLFIAWFFRIGKNNGGEIERPNGKKELLKRFFWEDKLRLILIPTFLVALHLLVFSPSALFYQDQEVLKSLQKQDRQILSETTNTLGTQIETLQQITNLFAKSLSAAQEEREALQYVISIYIDEVNPSTNFYLAEDEFARREFGRRGTGYRISIPYFEKAFLDEKDGFNTCKVRDAPLYAFACLMTNDTRTYSDRMKFESDINEWIFTINDAIDKKIPNTAYRIPENLIISSLYLEDVKENVKIELSPDNAALEKRFLDLTTTNLQKIIEKATLNSTN